MNLRTTAGLMICAAAAAASLALAQTTPSTSTTSAPAPVPAPAVLAPAPKPMIDYFLPTPIVSPLTKDVWGADNVLPRDQNNGLESQGKQAKFCYWDGQIIKAKDGKYHMFASRWDESAGHNGWGNSKAVHAVSDNLYGPYVDKGPMWPDADGIPQTVTQAGKGHNVTALKLPGDEGYAVVISETRPGEVWTCKDLNGPYTYKGKMTGVQTSNISIMIRPDGDFQIVPRNGQVYIAKKADGILGPYKSQGPSVFPRGIPNLEDPALFYAGGLYHITVNSWSTRKAYHLTSENGISDWKNRGAAYNPDADSVKYTDGTIDHWSLMERPAPYIEDGVVKAYTMAVLDVPKNQERGNDNHASKVIVIPFDGEAFNKDLAKLYADEKAGAGVRTRPQMRPTSTTQIKGILMPPKTPVAIFLVLLLVTLATSWSIAASDTQPQAEAAATNTSKIRVLILDGFSNHNWQLNTKLLRGLLEPTGLFDVSVSTCPPASSPDWAAWHPDFSKADVILQTCNDISQRPAPKWPDPVKADFTAFVKNGGGVFMNHSANNAFPDWPEYNDIIGLGWRPVSYGTALQMDADGKITKLPAGQGVATTHATRADVLVHNLPTDNPIHKDFPNAWKSPLLEVYVCARGPANNVQVLSYGQDPRNKQYWPIEWTVTYGQGRVYASSMGHVWSDESAEKQPVDLLAVDEQIILQRALQWLAKRPVTVPIPANFPTADKTSLSPNITLPK